jgi:hypothetical protein
MVPPLFSLATGIDNFLLLMLVPLDVFAERDLSLIGD